jgi:lactoylglutathione lyase
MKYAKKNYNLHTGQPYYIKISKSDTMTIDHLAIWTYDLEGMKNFYVHYFDASSGPVYYNHSREFRSYFLSFGGTCRLEIMEMPNVPLNKNNPLKQHTGLIHFAFNPGSRQKVDELTQRLKEDGFRVIGEPRVTGDNLYESIVLDPDGNRIELMAY